ncbi:hypothetical protein QEZ47_01895 [Aminobacter anthyllidis]|uniref:hypothetical protein n=1 Tax=Aminobacter anthyllidis TaxID=1035067 RepID=UPI002453D42F|nr:hypothetical protein [Aminobacter anthyllidis]MDH4984336.1 hypothetical protein [Aminobacter anthyllidis]
MAREEHKAFKDETARLAKATEAFERERKLAVERKSNLVEAADTIAGRKKLREVEALIEKAEKLSSDGKKPDRKKAAPKPVKSGAQTRQNKTQS